MSAGSPDPNAPPGADPAGARNRLAAVAFMAELIGHKARNRLASFRAVLEVLKEGWEQNLSPEYRELVLQQFEAFVGDFNLGLDMVRCDFGRMEECSVAEIAAEAVADFHARVPTLAVKIEADDGLKPVSTDRRLLRLVLLNLLRNAGQAAEGQSGIQVSVRVARIAAGVRLDVEDNGPGVPAPIQARLFREPVTTREDGTGLGLLLCRDAMTVLGGSIALAALPGAAGACFRLELPARPAVSA